MKYVLSFLAAFALVAGVTAFLRVRGGGPAAGPAKQTSDAGAVSEPKTEDHQPAAADESAPEKPAKEPEKKPDETPPGVTDIANTVDPVSGAKVSDPAAFTADWKGFRAHFADAKSVAKFKDDPIRYSAKLGLALDSIDDVYEVDPSTFRMPVLPEECPFCGQEPNPDVYILHRNFKIFFGWWMGCPEEFLRNPSEYYADYGLVEKDGTLMLKSEAGD